MGGTIRIHRHGFVSKHSVNIHSEFQPIWPGADDLELKMHIEPAT